MRGVFRGAALPMAMGAEAEAELFAQVRRGHDTRPSPGLSFVIRVMPLAPRQRRAPRGAQRRAARGARRAQVRSEEGALRYLDAIYAALGAVLHEVRPALLAMDAMRRTTSQGIGFRLG